ncbi:cytochrome P450, partial [Kalaharituber pfeilii]
YNLYLHPLAKFPGPKLAAISPARLAFSDHSNLELLLTLHFATSTGPVIRVAPNELSFSSAAAWKDIHGHRPRGSAFVKSDFYFPADDIYNRLNIFTEKDVVRHAELRRLLAHAFSAKALQEQEELIHKHIDLLVQRLGKRFADKEKGPDAEHCNLVHWYNFTTFDIIGDLAFGDAAAFECLENEKPHPFVTMILNSAYVMCVADIFRRYPFMLKLGYFFIPKKLLKDRIQQIQYSEALVKERMSTDTDRKDFMTYILDKKDAFPHIDIPSNAEVLVIAGSETTATQLSGLTYYLFKTPDAYQRLTDEIRTSFNNYSDITSSSTQHLPYLNAVIEEGLRIYPPAPFGMPRISPGAMVAGHFIPPGTEVSVHTYSASHSPENFAEPDRFLPERWLQDGNFNDRKEASQPFLLGPRGCLGRNLAYMQLRLILAKMLYCYDLEWVNTDLDWEKKSRTWLIWAKPELKVHIKSRLGIRWDELGLPDHA